MLNIFTSKKKFSSLIESMNVHRISNVGQQYKGANFLAWMFCLRIKCAEVPLDKKKDNHSSVVENLIFFVLWQQKAPSAPHNLARVGGFNFLALLLHKFYVQLLIASNYPRV